MFYRRFIFQAYNRPPSFIQRNRPPSFIQRPAQRQIRLFSPTIVKMVKDNETVIEEFNELVNMSAKELEEWLGKDESAGAGWAKADDSGETIGHERCVNMLTSLCIARVYLHSLAFICPSYKLHQMLFEV